MQANEHELDRVLACRIPGGENMKGALCPLCGFPLNWESDFAGSAGECQNPDRQEPDGCGVSVRWDGHQVVFRGRRW